MSKWQNKQNKDKQSFNINTIMLLRDDCTNLWKTSTCENRRFLNEPFLCAIIPGNIGLILYRGFISSSEITKCQNRHNIQVHTCSCKDWKIEMIKSCLENPNRKKEKGSVWSQLLVQIVNLRNGAKCIHKFEYNYIHRSLLKFGHGSNVFVCIKTKRKLFSSFLHNFLASR